MNATPHNNAHRLRDALPPECLAATHPIALLSRVYDPISLECLTDPNFFMDLEVSGVFYIVSFALYFLSCMHVL